MTHAELLLDAVLGLAVLVVAWSALHGRELFRGVVLYIVYGLLIALCWTRLAGPDIALAEAAIGAGITGALLLDAVRWMGDSGGREPGLGLRVAAGVVGAGVTAMLVSAVLALPREPGGLTADVSAAVEVSGVDHPVTAVLLNFRAYDTWLEVGVLLLAALLALALHRRWDVPPAGEETSPGPVLHGALRVLVPVGAVVAVYLLARGAYDSGGAFQAGAVGASLGVLLVVSGAVRLPFLGGLWTRALLVVGFLAFWAAAAATVLGGRPMLELPLPWAYAVILAIEAAVTVSIAAGLALVFVAARPPTAAGHGHGEIRGEEE